ncbi:MAG: MBL fold metallo-hydrolase [Desulfuromonadales bacterium]|nr:MBL fold metallo-hydrolase [Desulfuromonadales bacterium]
MASTDIRIRILVDNKAGEGLVEEHGFSAWIEVNGHRILFDTGQGGALAHNADMLGYDLRQIDKLVLSHGHYDHCGAVAEVVQTAPAARIFCHSNCFLPRYSIRSGEEPRSIAMPFSIGKALFDVPDNRVQWVTRPRMIESNVGISGPIARLHPMEDTGGPFFLDPEGRHPDPIRDDMAMWITTDRGLVIITGCCHAGLLNTVEHIRNVSGVEKILGIIGGLHLANASHDRLETTCSALRGWNPEFVIPCHCTGEEAQLFLRVALGARVTPGYAGFELNSNNIPEAMRHVSNAEYNHISGLTFTKDSK